MCRVHQTPACRQGAPRRLGRAAGRAGTCLGGYDSLSTSRSFMSGELSAATRRVKTKTTAGVRSDDSNRIRVPQRRHSSPVLPVGSAVDMWGRFLMRRLRRFGRKRNGRGCATTRERHGGVTRGVISSARTDNTTADGLMRPTPVTSSLMPRSVMYHINEANHIV